MQTLKQLVLTGPRAFEWENVKERQDICAESDKRKYHRRAHRGLWRWKRMQGLKVMIFRNALPLLAQRRSAIPIGTWDLLWRLSARLNLDPFFQVKRESTILRLGHSPLFSMLLPAFQTESLCSRSETFGFPFLPTVPHLSAFHLDASLHNSAPSHTFSSTHPEL